MGDQRKIGEVAIPGTGLGRPGRTRVKFEHRTYLVRDVVGDRIGQIASGANTGQLDRHQRLDLIPQTGHLDARDQIDVEPGELGGTQVDRDRDAERLSPLDDALARGNRELKEVANAGRHCGAESRLGGIELCARPVEVDVDRTMMMRLQPKAPDGQGSDGVTQPIGAVRGPKSPIPSASHVDRSRR
jgi:hypothetical protein